MKRAQRVALTESEADYLDGLLGAFEDMSDGAWQAACEDSIARESMFRGRDPYDVWLAWVEKRSVSRERK